MKKGGMYSEPDSEMDLSDIEGDEEFEIDDADISFASYPDINMNNETDRESMTMEQSQIEPINQSNDFSFQSQGSLHLSDLDTPVNQLSEPETTNESIMSLGGRSKKRRRLTRRKRITKRKGKKERKHKTYKKNKGKKTRKTKRRKYRGKGGNIDKLGSPDFNPNLAFDKKMIGGANVGATCNDPNYSIYNTRMLSLFPYTPKP